MAKHRTPRRPFWTLLGAGTIALGLTAAGLTELPVVHETAMSDGSCYDFHGGELCRADQAQVRTLPKGGVEVGDGSTVGCWVEKVQSAATAEVICGDKGDRPRVGTADVGAVFAERTPHVTSEDCGYVASWNADGWDIAPAGCN
jgi:hypothetical protein